MLEFYFNRITHIGSYNRPVGAANSNYNLHGSHSHQHHVYARPSSEEFSESYSEEDPYQASGSSNHYSHTESESREHYRDNKAEEAISTGATNKPPSSHKQGSRIPLLDDEYAYELVPSDVYFSQNRTDRDEIAAIIKPPQYSETAVKTNLPSTVSKIPTFNYPTHSLLQVNPFFVNVHY